MRAKGRRDLCAVAALTVLEAILVSALPAGSLARQVLVWPFVLVLPGYALTAALFLPGTAGPVEQAGLTLALSLATAALGGLLLNWLPMGLETTTWLALIGTVCLGACIVAWRRRTVQDAGPAARTALPIFSWGQYGLLALACLVALLAFRIAYQGDVNQRLATSTMQVWLLPADKSVTGHAYELDIANLEPASAEYRVEVEAAGAVLLTWSPVVLTPGGRWEAQFDLPSQYATQKIYAAVYRTDRPNAPYRQVSLSPAAAAK